MFDFFKSITNLGITDGQTLFEHRRIRLVNVFALISAVLLIVFGLLNFALGAYSQALFILSGCFIISIPPIYLNKIGKPILARFYFMVLGLIFIDFITFRAVFQFENRHNEVFLVGFSTLIVVLMDNPYKIIMFSFTALSTLVMITLRRVVEDLPISNDTYMAYLNTIVAFSCVYFFINIFKKEQSRSLIAIEHYNEVLEKQEKQIIKQRDEIFANRQLLRASIDSIPVFISLLDMDGNYLIANSKYEETFGIPISEIEGNHYSEILPDEILKTHDGFIKDGLMGMGHQFDEKTTLPDGTIIHVLGKYFPVFDSKNKQFALAVYVVDVTTLKETEHKLIELNETKNKLLSIISHDVRGPLNSLKGLMDISYSLTKDNISEFTKNISEKLGVVTFNLDNLLNWAKAQMEGFQINPSKVDIKELLINDIKLFQENLLKKNISIGIDCEEGVFAWADIESLNLILRNLISNAVKFTPIEGYINFHARATSDKIYIEIIDNGVGIAQEKIDDLQDGAISIYSKDGTEGEKGTGLGLSLSIDIVKKNKGTLELSNNKTQGTTARITLPKAN